MPVIPASVVQEVLERDGYKCVYCGDPLTAEAYTLDHFTPLCANGPDEAGNLVASCAICNSIKGRRIFSTVEEVRSLVLHLRDRGFNLEPGAPFKALKKKRPSKYYRKPGRKRQKASEITKRSLALWREANRRRVNEGARVFYQKVKDKRNAQMKERYASNREEIALRQDEARQRRAEKGEEVAVRFLALHGVVVTKGDVWTSSSQGCSDSGTTLYKSLKRLSRHPIGAEQQEAIMRVSPLLGRDVKVGDVRIFEKELERA